MPVDLKYANQVPVYSTLNPGAPKSNTNNQTKTADGTQKQWGVRVAQVTTPQTLSNNVAATIGFDSPTYNTYQALGSPKYALSWVASGPYPYFQLQVPVSGMYSIKSQILIAINSLASGEDEMFQTFFVVNGVELLASTNILSNSSGRGSPFNLMQSLLCDDVFIEANSLCSIAGYISNSSVARTGTINNTSITSYFTTRFLGRG